MSYFDACEACGQSELLVLDGLCFECQRKAARAAHGSSTLPRASGLVFEDGRIRTYLVPRVEARNDDQHPQARPSFLGKLKEAVARVR